MYEKVVDNNSIIKIKMASGGGVAIRISKN